MTFLVFKDAIQVRYAGFYIALLSSLLLWRFVHYGLVDIEKDLNQLETVPCLFSILGRK